MTSPARRPSDPRQFSWPGTGGLRLIADDYGSGSPVVLLHGGGQTRHSWGRACQRIAETGRRVLAPDLRGHGDSEHARDGDYSIDALVGDLRSLLGHLGAPAALAGASLGGLTALATTGESRGGGPGLVTALILVDVVPRLESRGTDRVREFMAASPEGFETVNDAADAVASYLPHRPERDASGLARNLRRGPDGRLRWHWDPALVAQGPDDDVARREARMSAAARRVRVPTLLLRGGDSDVVSPQGAQHFLGLVPHAEFGEIRGATHMIAGDSNDGFTARILRFLSGHLPAEPDADTEGGCHPSAIRSADPDGRAPRPES